MGTLICKCGKEKASTQKKICDDCRKQRRKEKSRLDAKKYRDRHGHSGKRGVNCYRCGNVKEHPERGYCLACERERYKEKEKPNCTTCGTIKENPRDAYCNACKRNKAAQKSIEEGRRFKNTDGRKTTCSKCGCEKEEGYLSESYCRKCKLDERKRNRPYRNADQIYKEAVRKLTNRKIRQGVLIKQPCEVCGTEEKIEAHHDDYMKPLDVRWLCRFHHQEHHRTDVQRED